MRLQELCIKDPTVDVLALIEPIEIRTSTETRASWDSFAVRCGASFRSAWRAKPFQFDHHAVFRLHRFDLLSSRPDGARQKIGQVALGIGAGVRVFADCLQILPEHQHHWAEAMRSVLAHCGPGRYRYGSIWSLEPSRDEALRSLRRVSVVRTRGAQLFSVDFARWPCWESYLHDVSSNAKRNARKARNRVPEPAVRLRRGLAALLDARDLIRLREAMCRRKNLAFSGSRCGLRMLSRQASYGAASLTATIGIDGRTVAALAALEFGPNTYHLEGAAERDNQGLNWFLILDTIRRARDRAPQGRFVTGPLLDDAPSDPGIDFFRHQCRARPVPTGEVEFVYRAA